MALRAGNSLGLVAQTSMRLSLLRQGAFSGLPRRGKIFGFIRKPLLRRRVFRSSLSDSAPSPPAHFLLRLYMLIERLLVT